MPPLRTLLILGRTSNLPTVWSNCLAGFLLGNGTHWTVFAWLCLGTTLLYTGGMFLNDAFDASFDQQHRPERPIPSGQIQAKKVWQIGCGLLGAGFLCLFWISTATFLLTLALVVCILVYDAIHKAIHFAPVLMAGCRFFLILVAASAGAGLTGIAIWSALVLACYVIGLSYLARKESTRGVLHSWPAYFLATPILLAFLVDDGPYRRAAMYCSGLLLGWLLLCLRHTFWKNERNVGYTVSGLLAGIVLVDLLAIAGGTPAHTIIFLLLFAAANVFQRFIPAT